jgi:hypothetical protein
MTVLEAVQWRLVQLVTPNIVKDIRISRSPGDSTNFTVLLSVCLRPLEHWDRGFETHSSMDACVYSVFMLGSGLATG